MSDFMNGSEYCCQAAYEAPQTEYVIAHLKGQRDGWKAKAEDRDRVMAVRARDYHAACKGRDDARLEADRLKAELARLARERDGATSELQKLEAEREEFARVLTIAEPLRPCQDVAKTIGRLERIASIIGAQPAGVRRDAEVRLAQVGMIVGRMLGEMKG